MNEEIRNQEIREDDLEKVNGGTGFGILPDFDITKREQRNREINQSDTELDDDMLKNVTGGIKVGVCPFDKDFDDPLSVFGTARNTPRKG